MGPNQSIKWGQIKLANSHASIKTTLDTYGHLCEGIDEALAEALDTSWRRLGPDGDGQ